MSLDGGSFKQAALALGGLLGCSLLSSVLFYLATNAVCLGWYEPTLAGVIHCYVQGLPFFKYTLAGDMLFALATFGAYAAVMQFVEARVVASATGVSPVLPSDPLPLVVKTSPG
jgi:hypothetical protein